MFQFHRNSMAMVLPRVSDILFSTVSVADNRVAYPSILYATYPRPRHILVHLHAADPAPWYIRQQYVLYIQYYRSVGMVYPAISDTCKISVEAGYPATRSIF
jgi:hypothetical protein